MFLDACEPEIEVLNTILADYPADILVGDTATLHAYFLSELTGIPSAMIPLFPLVHSYDWDVAPYGLGILPGETLLAKMRNRILNFIVNIILLRDVDLHMNAVHGRLGLPPLKEPFFQAIPRIPDLILHISTPAFEYHSKYQLDTLTETLEIKCSMKQIKKTENRYPYCQPPCVSPAVHYFIIN